MDKMEYNQDSIIITVSKQKICVQGDFDKFDMDDIDNFLKQAEKQIENETIILDLRKIFFVNSKAIKMFARFIHLSKKKIEVYIDSAVEWQIYSFSSFHKLKSKGQVKIIRS